MNEMTAARVLLATKASDPRFAVALKVLGPQSLLRVKNALSNKPGTRRERRKIEQRFARLERKDRRKNKT
jgi:hypothetical protein